MEYSEIQGWLTASKTAVELIKGALNLLPKSGDREKAEEQIKIAEEARGRSDAALATHLGFTLCPCTFPPQIMLCEQEKATVCPREECGRRLVPRRFRQPISAPSPWLD